MKSKKRIVALLLVSTLFLSACAVGKNMLGNVDKNTSSPYTSSSSVSFSAKEGDTIKLSVHTTTKQGTAEFAIFDEEGNLVSDWSDWCSADDYECTFAQQKDKVYELRVEYTDFVGHFAAKVWSK